MTSPQKATVEVSTPQQKPWPMRYSPEELIGKTCSAILPEGKILEEEYLQYIEQLGIMMPLTFSEAVDFFLVDNLPWRTDNTKPEVLEILKRAMETNLPIYSLSYLRLCARAIDTPTERDAAADSLTLEEETGLVLKLDDENFNERVSKDEYEAFDELERQDLFNDSYVKFTAEEQSHIVVDDPPRIAGTRWKVDAVLNSYLPVAWEHHGDTRPIIYTTTTIPVPADAALSPTPIPPLAPPPVPAAMSAQSMDRDLADLRQFMWSDYFDDINGVGMEEFEEELRRDD